MKVSRRDLLKSSGSVAATMGCGFLPLITPGQAYGDPLISSGQAVSMSGGSLINLSSGGTIPGSSLLRHENNVATAFMNMAQSGTNSQLTDIASAVLTQFPSVNLNFPNLALSGAQQTGINIHPAIPYVQPEMNAGAVLSALGRDMSFLQNDFCNILSAVAADIFTSTGVSYDQEAWAYSNRCRQDVLLQNARGAAPSRLLDINLTDSNLPG